MITVGIRNLKDSLSQYLKMVKGGERIIVTDHNRIIAEIIPASATDEKAELIGAYITEQANSGKLSPATRRTRLDRARSAGKPMAQQQIDDLYEQTRNERQ